MTGYAVRKRMGRAFSYVRGNEKDVFLKLKLPSALPYFFSALKIAVPLSVIGAAIGEWLGAQAG